ncbi:sensor histidine kinase [Nonomuraea dietziae]|uniref:sensor histidine kinase n=1 Tax=Nonomuraea dietziae TaxID=65515 RepID=UPI0033D8B985
MRLRNTRLRTKVTALLLSLAALWSFAAWVTLREGVNLLWVAQLDSSVVGPSEPLLVELQRERRASMIQLGERSPRSRKELQDQRQRADRTKAEFETSARAGIVEWAVDDLGEKRLADMFAKLDDLASIRQSVDAGRVTRIEASAAYADVIDSVYRMYGAMATLDDKTLAGDIRTLMALSKAREILAREDALLAGALAQGRLDAEEHEQFTRTAGAWHIVAEQAASELPDADRAAYDKLIKGRSFTRLHDLETLLARQGSVVETIPFSAEQWKAATEQALTDFNGLVLGAGDRVVERATPVAVGVVVRLALAGGLGLIAVVASIVLSITTARALFAQLQKLRDAAHELSDERLPRVVERIGNGERVDVAVEAPPLQFGTGEIGQVGEAFNTVQETAIRIAAEQAALRQSIRDILISMARRTQGLVQRQLNVLDVMERRETDPVELEDLFRLDHLAVRTRRNAENLIVLSGSSPARTWRRSVPMVDVVRGALAEVEDYTRVSLMPMGDVVLVGRAVGDVVHLLAELIENAVSFSPPYTNVQVSGQLVANGYVVEIEDRGLGMKPEDLAAANERIANPPEFRITGATARLGLYVVSRLAARHQIQVVLKASPYGGTTVVVMLPQELVETGPVQPLEDEPLTSLPIRQTTATATRATATRVPATRQPARPASPQTGLTALPQRTAPPAADSEPAEEAAPAAPTPTGFTPSGLPFRVPQANLVPALREEAAPTPPSLIGPPPDEQDDDLRSPEEIRAMMQSLQSGNRRGRSAAEKLIQDHQSGDDA